MTYNLGLAGESGNRFYLSYSGSAPSGANCNTLAGDIESQWSSHLAAFFTTNYFINEVDVIDIATVAGASGTWSGSTQGTRAGTASPYQLALGIEFGIARRYRGGKPRVYLPGLAEADIASGSSWNGSTADSAATAFAAFISGIEALSIGSMGTLQHVNLSYYSGYQPRTTGGGQTTFKPKYRTDSAHVDNVTGYFAKHLISSQKRRRTATTP